MLFKTIRSTLTAFNSLTIAVLCVIVLSISVFVHEDLYSEAVTNNLDGLSNNMAYDLSAILSRPKIDIASISGLLQRLEEYENVTLAAVFDQDYKQLDTYAGKSLQAHKKDAFNGYQEQLNGMQLGMSIKNGRLFSFKSIGEKAFPNGYLLIVNDLEKPLNRSKLSLLLKVLPLTVVVISIGIVLSLWLNSKILLPFQKLMRLAHQIKETDDYSIDINVDGKQEAVHLSDAISSMMDTIHSKEIKNKEYTEQLMQQRKDMERRANFDSLTGLPNRQFFMETLRKSLNAAKHESDDMVLMYLDLDGFKGVNDTHGQEMGDKLLIEASKRARRFLRHGDLIARLDGGEFLILLHNDPNEFVVMDIAERIIRAISKPFDINNWEILISVSIGMAKATDANYNLSAFVNSAVR